MSKPWPRAPSDTESHMHSSEKGLRWATPAPSTSQGTFHPPCYTGCLLGEVIWGHSPWIPGRKRMPRAIPRPPYLHELPHGDGSITCTEGTRHVPTGPFAPHPSAGTQIGPPTWLQRGSRGEEGWAPGSSWARREHMRVSVYECMYSAVPVHCTTLRPRSGRAREEGHATNTNAFLVASPNFLFPQ